MSLEKLKQQRASTKKSLTRIRNIVEASAKGEGNQLSITELKCRISIAEAYFKQVLSFQTQIEVLNPEDDGRSDLEDGFIALQKAVQQQMGTELHDHDTTIGNTSMQFPIHHNKLPSLKLPTFSGKYSEYKNFITSFKQVIDREVGLSNIEKFNHLRNCLQGPALDTINAFQINNENYPKALERLKARFDNATLIFMENVVSLFELPSMTMPDSQQLRSIVDNASALYSALLSLGSERDISNAMIIHIIMAKVDEESRNKWRESLDFVKLPTWDECTKVLDRRCQYLQSMDGTRAIEQKRSVRKPQRYKQASTFALAKRSCQLCNSGDHVLANCKQFKTLDVLKCFEKVKELRLCLNCLSGKHQVSQCSSTFKCKICAKAHHTSLHRGQPVQQPQQQVMPFGGAPEQRQHQGTSHTDSTAVTHSHFERSPAEQVILATAVVMVRSGSGVYRPGRALLDSGSQVNIITDAFSQTLRLPRKKHCVKLFGIGESETNTTHIVSSTIKSRHTDFQMSLDFCITPHISYQPEPEIDISAWNIPQNTVLADETFHKSRHIDLLIGTEGFFDLLSVGQIKLGCNMPTLQKTLFGWVVSGRYKREPSTALPQICLMTFEQTLVTHLERLWLLEEVPRKLKTWTPAQQDCETFFLSTVSRNSNGRIIVRLPFKEASSSLGRSYDIAMRRFISQERRLSHQEDLKSQYIAFMAEFESLGHMSLVPHPNLDKPHFYIPHHCVLKPTSTSTKLRVVFDASCKTSTQKSLNDILLVCPTIQDDLFSLLLRFRLYRYAISADIVKMFRQVLIHTEDLPFQYILWRSSPQDKICIYQINTVAYGTASAPYLAVRALHYLADIYAKELPVGSQALKTSFYVDDFLCGADSVEQLSQIKYEVTEILKRGCFELAKWHSNHSQFMDDRTVKDIKIDDAVVTSALGINWDQKRDAFLFSFKTKPSISNKSTKRLILSTASSLFDPLGLLAPLIIRAKIILQELWLIKINWDESVPQNLHSAWQTFLKDLNSLSLVTVPRYCLAANSHNMQLHGFCNSSIRGYGCCLYLRVQDSLGNISLNLLTAKSKVAPTKKKSLPKLELCGAKLLATLYDTIKSSLRQQPIQIFLWTDSQIVLYWIKQHSATLSAFVGNRVADIQELTAEYHWRHVPTKCNPADIVSRGCTVEELTKSMWFSGPPFLFLRQSQWPENKYDSPNIADINNEKRKAVFHSSIKYNYILQIIEDISSYTKILRIVGWMFRPFRVFTSTKDHVKVASDCLMPAELEKALWCIVWNIQRHHFEDEIRRVQKHECVDGPLKGYNPFLQETCGFPILKVGGRLELANISVAQKHPAILPSKCTFVNRLVRHLHLTNFHAGAKALVALIRNNFWIVNARDVARRTVRNCLHCVRYKPKLLEQMMGNLPAERLTSCRPFQKCAVDFCGPIDTYLRIRGKRPYKTYVAVFVCMASKAVHIEVVSKLSTNAFIAALKRLIGRRGLPTDIFCDNATNFVGANNKLAELRAFIFKKQTQQVLTNFCTNEFINFHFIPPRAPHFGGLWEAAVKSAKSHLNRTFLNVRLTYEELTTALVEIEAVLNSRPISPLSSDPNDLAALTPAHLLIGDSLKALPEHPTTGQRIELLDRWTRITAIKQQFWQQWSRDYLNELQCRTKWTGSSPNVASGSLVIIQEDNMPPQKWQLGRVVHCVPGRDDKVRVVDVRTAKGIIRRPIHKIAVLPA